MFPGVTRLLNGKRMVGMMADAEGNRLLPLRIEYQPGCTIQVVTQNTPTPSPLPSPALSPLPSPALHPKIPTRTSSQQPTPSTFPTSTTMTTTTTTQNDSSKTGELLRRASVLEAPNIPASVKEEFRTSVNLYESFVQAVRSGQTEDTNVIRNDFRTHFTALEGEMAKNADLQQQMFEMQQSMALRDAVHRSNLLYLDLSCTNAPSMTAMLGRTKVSNPLWEMMINAKLHMFILSAYKGFFSDTSFSARMTDLRRLKISDQLNWKKDGPRLLELIRHSPMLLDLSIECNNLPEAYMAITNAFGITFALEKLSLQSGPQNRILVRHEKGSVASPGAVDLWVSDPTSPLLDSMTNLCSLQIRTELHIPIGKHLSTLTTIMLKNPSLRELWIRCQLSELCEVFETVRAVAATMGTMTSLKLLRAYRSHIQLFTSNLQDGTATILELLSSEPNPTLLPPLLKGYGNRLTKVKISNGNLSAPFWTGPAVDQLLLQGDVSRIQHIELECSSLTEPMCRALLCVLNHPSFPSAPIHFSIKVDIDPKKSKLCEEMAKFIVDCSRWLTEVLVEVQELERWKGAFLATGKKPVLQESIIKTYDNWQAVRMARKLHENVFLHV
ncbi:hypothetical protein K457DRAFT_901197 [Linnemannia elongata AG-77]|uniref:RNI-like protein n=1 Tax=Linnemannia elongata AG-77 TaxID=1314771 RepID=A0A197KBQ3_9FUNG|nr:hypothetical protein K457DRAFT_901197 [Linnemannia elongata AG-77]